MPSSVLNGLPMRLVLAVLAALCIAVLVGRELTWRMDTWIYDFLLSRTTQEVDERILLVVIDERSVSALGRWPWPRVMHADLLERLRLANVRGIAFNAVFSEPARDDPGGDRRLAEALERAGNIALPVMAEASEPGGMPIEVLPMPILLEAQPALGHVDAEVDRDGVARQASLFAGMGSAHWPALALALLGTGSDGPAAPVLPGLKAPEGLEASSFQWVRDRRIFIPYAPPGTFPQASYIDVLEGRIAPELLQDRWVLVGTVASGIDQGLFTPRTVDRGRLSTVEYHANLLNALLLGHAIQPLAGRHQWALSLTFVLLPLALYGGHARWRRTWLVSALAATATLLCCVLMLRYGRYWFQPVPTLIVLAAMSGAWALHTLRRSQRLAHSDPLTLVANRRLFDLILDRELKAAQRTRQPLSLLVIDVDHFKHYNDRYGHQAGDQVLRRVAATIVAHARRPRDLPARYGGDELTAILPETSRAAAVRIAEAIVEDVRVLAIPHEDSEVAPIVTVTIGVATFDPVAPGAGTDLLDCADAALYHAKRSGRNRAGAGITG